MNTGMLGYIGPEAEEVAARRREIAAALGLSDRLALLELRPAPNCVIFLVHAAGVLKEEAFFRSKRGLFAYAGNVFSGADARHFPGSPFARPALLAERLLGELEVGGAVDRAGIDGHFAAFCVETHEGLASGVALFNDSFGIQPLFHFKTGRGGFAFSNFAEAIHAAGVHGGRLNGSALAGFLTFGLASFERCFLEDVARLPANSLAAFKADGAKMTVRRGEDFMQWREEPVREDDLAEEVYWAVRAAVRRRTRNLASPLLLKISGGYDSSFLLHCLLEDKTPFTALNERNPDYYDQDSAYPQRLAKEFGFPLEVVFDPPSCIEDEPDEEIRGPGRLGLSIRDHKMLGSFAAISLKAKHRKSFRKVWEECKTLRHSPLLERFPVEENIALRERSVARFSGRDLKHKTQRWALYNHYAGFMVHDEETRFSRPHMDFAGSRLLPFCDERLFEITLRRYHDGIEPKTLYARIFERFMPEMLRVPMFCSAVADNGPEHHRRIWEENHAHRLKRLPEFMELEAFRAVFPAAPPESISPAYFTLFYLLGLWLTVCAPGATIPSMREMQTQI